MRSLALSLLIGSSLFLGACSNVPLLPTGSTERPVVKRPLVGTEWVLVMIDGQPAPRLAPTLTLSDVENQKRAMGFAGCNRFFGGYVTVGDALNFNSIAGTLMACPDLPVEQAYLDALSKTTRYRLDSDVLELLQGNELRLRFQAKPAD